MGRRGGERDKVVTEQSNTVHFCTVLPCLVQPHVLGLMTDLVRLKYISYYLITFTYLCRELDVTLMRDI